MLPLAEVDELARRPSSVVVSATWSPEVGRRERSEYVVKNHMSCNVIEGVS